jgi:predicted Zn-ribbon and HTH transcriptional regulator
MVLQYKPKDGAGTGYPTTTFDTVPTHVSTCPDCDSEVIDGQGVLGCADCSWAGFVA